MSGIRAKETRSGRATAFVLTAMFSVLLSLFTEETERDTSDRNPLYRVRNGKKIMADSPRYQVPGAIGINQHYCKIDISEVPPPSLSPPLMIATKAFVVLLG